MKKFEKLSIIEKTDEEVFQGYMEDLRFTPEDFDKKILDVGSGASQFAKWAKEHGVSKEIYSLEPRKKYILDKQRGVAARAEAMPFANESFDLIVSVAAIPNVYINAGDAEAVKEAVVHSLYEMIRVLKFGGEIRLARVLIGRKYESQRILAQNLDETLQELQEGYGVQIKKIRTPHNDTYEYEGHERKNLRAEAYLLIIQKPVLYGVAIR